MDKVDLTVAYRIYPKISKQPLFYPKNKLSLTELGVHSFAKALGSLRVKVFFLLDNCPVEYEEMILKYFRKEDVKIYKFNGIGNLATFGKQIELLLDQSHSDAILFLEDDYLFQPGCIPNLLKFLNQSHVDFVTPYDHIDNYQMSIHSQHKYKIEVSQGSHWRTTASTCMTFFTKKIVLKKTVRTFKSYCRGNWDSSLWFALTKHNVFRIDSIKYIFTNTMLAKALILSWLKTWPQIVFGRKYDLWQPLPSAATHLESTGIAPVVDWGVVKKRVEVTS